MTQAKLVAFLDDISHFLKLYEGAGGHIGDLRRIDSATAETIVATVAHGKRILRETDGPMPVIEDLGLDVRLLRILDKYDITTIEELTNTTERQLRIMSGVGANRIGEIKEALRRQRLQLKPAHHEGIDAVVNLDSDESHDQRTTVEGLLLTA